MIRYIVIPFQCCMAIYCLVFKRQNSLCAEKQSGLFYSAPTYDGAQAPLASSISDAYVEVNTELLLTSIRICNLI